MQFLKGKNCDKNLLRNTSVAGKVRISLEGIRSWNGQEERGATSFDSRAPRVLLIYSGPTIRDSEQQFPFFMRVTRCAPQIFSELLLQTLIPPFFNPWFLNEFAVHSSDSN